VCQALSSDPKKTPDRKDRSTSPSPSLGSVVGSASIYAGTSALTIAAPVILLPVLTRYLSPTDYGIVAIFQVLLGLFGAFVGLNVHGAVSREYFGSQIADFPAFVSSCVLIFAVSGVVSLGVAFVFQEAIMDAAGVPAAVVMLAPLVAFATGITSIRLNLWQSQARPTPYGALQVSLSLLQVALTIWLVIDLGFGWQGRVAALGISAAIFMGVALVLLRREGFLPARANVAYVKTALSFGVPLVPHVVGSWAIAMVDRMLLTTMVGLSATGVYAVGAQLGMAIGLLEDACNKAWVPWFFEQLETGRPGTDKRVIRVAIAYAALLIGAALALGLVTSQLLPFIAGPQYQGAAPFVTWIALGYAFGGIYKISVNYLFFYRRTGTIATITLLTGALNLAITTLLIKYEGAIGAAHGVCAGFFLTMLFTTVAAVRTRRKAISAALLQEQFA
jgi:O-antigen/teichoic acid export membrane protein